MEPNNAGELRGYCDACASYNAIIAENTDLGETVCVACEGLAEEEEEARQAGRWLDVKEIK